MLVVISRQERSNLRHKGRSGDEWTCWNRANLGLEALTPIGCHERQQSQRYHGTLRFSLTLGRILCCKSRASI